MYSNSENQCKYHDVCKAKMQMLHSVSHVPEKCLRLFQNLKTKTFYSDMITAIVDDLRKKTY